MVERSPSSKELKHIDKTTMISVLEESFRNVLAKMFGTDENLDVINPFYEEYFSGEVVGIAIEKLSARECAQRIDFIYAGFRGEGKRKLCTVAFQYCIPSDAAGNQVARSDNLVKRFHYAICSIMCRLHCRESTRRGCRAVVGGLLAFAHSSEGYSARFVGGVISEVAQ